MGAATVAAGSPSEVLCQRCEKPFGVRRDGPGRQARYCSQACRQATYKQARTPPVGEQRQQVRRELEGFSVTGPDLTHLTGAVEDLSAEHLAQFRRHLSGLIRHWEALAALAGPHLPDVPAVLPPTRVSVTPPPVTETLFLAPVPAHRPVPAPVRPAAPIAPMGRIAGLTPTGEQADIITACRSGANLVIEAGAGTGKTSTLKMAASLMEGRRGLYIAFNKAIATAAARSFPKNVTCSTAHSLAFRAVGSAFKARLDGPRLPARESAKRLGVTKPLSLRDGDIPATQLVRLAMETVGRFCRSADAQLAVEHVPEVNGVDGPAADALRNAVFPLAVRAWEDLTDVNGTLRFSHDVYLKMWALTGPQLKADFILFDEAQDADPLIASVVQAQQAQLIAVGDTEQAIYEWRGAINAIQTWPARERLFLTQSWRFGPRIADEANKWLELLNARLRLSGTPSIASRVASIERPAAILCRTNAEALRQTMNALDRRLKVALVGGGAGPRRLAEAAASLQAGKGTDHPELFAFSSWGEVQEYVRHDEAGADLASLVRLVDEHGADALIDAAKRLVADEKYADVVISTAHKAKGREWASVRIADDFRQPKADDSGRPGKVPKAEARLAYVAVTRAMQTLDRGGLEWIDDQLAGRSKPNPWTMRGDRDADRDHGPWRGSA
ncbi:UvrD-helicase domain-containing protein [Streptosporangium sp. NPDC023615]|uniref:UvrD-helicase domain-containing protein n=1 Tax=Streptosporangium sp. NPDC023615 TaxID=3154794 RepID=UPI00342D6DEE